jgi:hypothetical protein
MKLSIACVAVGYLSLVFFLAPVAVAQTSISQTPQTSTQTGYDLPVWSASGELSKI